MRMKKIMILAVAAIALVACSRTFETHQANEPAIGFGTWAETLTKVRTQGTSEFGSGDTFSVEGFKTVGGTPTTVFDDVTVSTENGTTWTYENTRFWDSSASSYDFYAVSPAGALTFEDDGTINATEIVFSGKNNDILLADAVNVTPPYSSSAVNLSFKHIASLVDLKVKKTSTLNTATVNVSSVSITGVDVSGKVAVPSYPSSIPGVSWSDQVTGSYGPTSGVSNAAVPTDVSTSGDDLIKQLIVMPQTLTDTRKLVISYTITDAAGNVNTFSGVEIKLNQFDKVENEENVDGDEFISSWEAAKHYVYTLTISANTISFTANITDWTTVNGFHYLVK